VSTQAEDDDVSSTKEKLLNFYFVFFENLNMNRSLVLMILDTDRRAKWRKLADLKKQHRTFIQSLDIQSADFLAQLPESFQKYSDKPMEEVLWIHFLSILKYWKRDDSAGFE